MGETSMNILLLLIDVVKALIIAGFLNRFIAARKPVLAYLLVCAWFLGIDGLAFLLSIGSLASSLLLFAGLLMLCWLMLKGDLISSAAGSLIVVTINSVLGNILNAILNIAAQTLLARDVGVVNVLVIAASAGLLFLLLHYIGKNFLWQPQGRQNYIFTLLLPLAMIFIFSELFAWATLSDVVILDAAGFGHPHPRLMVSGWLSLFVFLFALLCVFVLFFAYRKFREYDEKQQRTERLDQELAWQRKALAEAKLRHVGTQAYRHDLHNHLSVLSGLIGRGDYENAQAYLKKIGGFARELSNPVNSGSAVLDVLLNEKIDAAKRLSIYIDCQAAFAGQGIDDYDLCVLLGNALDNAIKACAAVPEGERWITIRIKQVKSFLHICIANAKSETAHRRKGYGLMNMDTITEKYDGSMQTTDNGKIFELNVLLAIPLQKQDDSLQNG